MAPAGRQTTTGRRATAIFLGEMSEIPFLEVKARAHNIGWGSAEMAEARPGGERVAIYLGPGEVMLFGGRKE